MNERCTLLERWGLSPALVHLVAGALPHPLFRRACEVIQPHHRVSSWAEVEGPDRDQPRAGEPLWGRDLGGARYYEVVYCVRSQDGRFEFWWVPCSISNDQEPRLVARSEQGLYFWLFSHLLDVRYEWLDRTVTDEDYREAAEAVGFRHLTDLIRFRTAEARWVALYEERLRHRAATLMAEPVAAPDPAT